MGAYDRVIYHGKTVNKRTQAMIQLAEKRLGYELTIIQGSYNRGVGASAGTHDGGGVIDLAPFDWPNKVRVLRSIGFAAWHRPAISGLWTEHIHAVAIGDRELAPAAKRQVQAYYAGRNGLADNGADPHPRPNPIRVFSYYSVDLSNIKRQWDSKTPKAMPGVRLIQRALNRRGYNVVVDGVPGPQTRGAFASWSGGFAPNLRNLSRLGRGHFRAKK